MSFSIFNCKIEISFFFVSFLCLILFVDTTGLMLFGILSVLIHECGHLFAMIITKFFPKKISFQLGGVLIDKSYGMPGRNSELFIALGGCIFNFLAFMALFWIYIYYGQGKGVFLFCASNLSLLLFNILPIKGLDGTDILQNIFERRLSAEKSERAVNFISIAFLCLLFLLSVTLLCTAPKNYSLFVCFCYLLILSLINIRR